MKKILTLALLLYTYFFTYAQTKTDDETAIRRVIADQEAAWNRGDLEAFMEGYWKSDSLTFIGSRGVTYGWQATLDSYKKGYPDAEAMGKLTFTILQLEILSAQSAYVIGKWKLARSKDEPGGHFTLLWKKIAGKWVIVADHTS
ncbi:MAG: nuclear transport factor 2 family protein [Saprospiraceae bacterium]